MPTHLRNAFAISVKTAFVIFTLFSLLPAAFAQHTVQATTNASAQPVYIDSARGDNITVIRVFQATNPNGVVEWDWNDPTPSNGHAATAGQCVLNGGIYTCAEPCLPNQPGNTAHVCPGPPLTWDSGNLTNSSRTFSLQFDTADVYPLWCRLHGGVMNGVVVAQDYSLNLSPSVGYAYVNTAATFNGTLTGLPNAPTYPFPAGTGPYNSSVLLTCTGGSAPATCNSNPASPTPGTPFTVTAQDVAGDYSFTLAGIGFDPVKDPDSLQRSSNTAALHVVSLSLTTPAAITTASNSTSATSSFNVTAKGTFPGTITLSCTNLPAGASCTFLPSNTVTPNGGAAQPYTVQVVTSGTTPADYALTISADPGGGGLAAKTAPLTLHVQDFSIAVNPPTTKTVAPTVTANYTGTLTSLNGYVGSVSVACVGTPPPLPGTCADASSPHTLTSNGSVGFTLGASNPIAAPQFNFNIQGSGPSPASSTPTPVLHSVPVKLNVGGFTMSVPNPATVSAVSGNPSNASSVVLSTTGAFAAVVTLTCPAAPVGVTCNFYPSSVVDLTGPPVTVTITLNTTSSTPLALGQNVTIRAIDANGGVQNQTLKLDVTPGTPGTNLSVQLTHPLTPDPVIVGQPARFNAHVVNNGPNSATGVVVLFDFSQPVAILATSGGTCTGSGPVQCTVAGALLSLAGTNVSVTVSTSFTRTLIAHAQVSSNATETVPANNLSSDTALIRLRPWKPSGTPPVIP